ncbi:phage portal protein [Niveispirillum sp.]|uniref:phage portal protein n=1 Tax=Niveispirillum sp. TaxID=1917217 RepID=UPI001B3D604D|nr:phage portal protein [Niveispirillum sp.]MBP7339420.1 phage portal protein [Niveispirillum sp.]
MAFQTRARIKGTGLYIDQMAPALSAPAAPGGAKSAHWAASRGVRLAGWQGTASGPNSIVEQDGELLRVRNRDLTRNSGMARRLASLTTVHVVGSGIVPRWTVEDTGLRKDMQDLYALWVDVSDADGILGFYGQQALAMAETCIGGEALARMRTRLLSDGLPVPLQVQQLPAEQLPLHYSTMNGANRVRQGIERNSIGRRIAYWMHRQHPGDMPLTSAPDTWLMTRVDAGDMCHLFNQERIGQQRGLPWAAAAMTTLYNIGDYLDSEQIRKGAVAKAIGVLKRPAPSGMDAEALAGIWGQMLDKNGGLPAVGVEAGTLNVLDVNEELEFHQPADVGGNFEAFLNANYRQVAAAADVLFEELTGNWSGANDRTFRAQFATFKRRARQWQWNLLIHQHTAPIIRRFNELAVASGIIKLPRSTSLTDLQRVTFVPERWEHLHPKQDIEAQVLEIENMLTSRSAVIASRGDDPEAVDAEIRRDRQREATLPPGRAGAGARPAPPPNEVEPQTEPAP